jgi:hypothetical protein
MGMPARQASMRRLRERRRSLAGRVTAEATGGLSVSRGHRPAVWPVLNEVPKRRRHLTGPGRPSKISTSRAASALKVNAVIPIWATQGSWAGKPLFGLAGAFEPALPWACRAQGRTGFPCSPRLAFPDASFPNSSARRRSCTSQEGNDHATCTRNLVSQQVGSHVDNCHCHGRAGRGNLGRRPCPCVGGDR